ncbi:phage-related baseplate assembly protein [Ancylobacter sp. 3268]|uniref:baseplate J/gp47 family protein n=1 Tax=Ancylobacter sp. 3268 TaxID=2817752 RepID=UPI0028597442|nr:baseplate J/gp47 family protein [Ancylobacter sp. 3268]MDR6952689.1 phage-related baseplate assembly protein [Ancylobacter sp. 3268]
MSLSPTRVYTLDQLIAAGEPQFFSADPLYYKNLVAKHFEGLTGRKLYEGQVEMYMIETMAYALQVRGAEKQMAVIQRLLPFAKGRFLDLIGARLNTYRLAASTAALTVRFTLAGPRPSSTVVEAGTRVRAEGGAGVFLTTADLVIAPGAAFGDVGAMAAVAGLASNGVQPGAALTILDPVAGVQTAAALTLSDGGADEEKDDPFRARIAEAWELISRGGPREGYRQLALGAHPAIIDVAVIRPEPCLIDLYVLTETLPLPVAVSDAVMAACDPMEGRPEGDEVTVYGATAVPFAPTLRLWIDGDTATIAAQAEGIARGVFAAWRRMLGPRVSTAAVTSPIKQLAGIVEAEIEGYSYQALAPSEFAELTSLTVVVEEA